MNEKKILPLAGALALALSITGCTASSTPAGEVGDDYPSKNMTMIVGYGPGGSTDVGARLMASALEEKLGISITVENQEGAGGQVGLTAIANAQCDGYTFGTANFPSAIVSVLDESRQADYTTDSFAPISLMVVDPTAIVVAPDSPIKTVDDLIAAGDGSLKYTTTGVASNEHFAMVALEQESGKKYSPVHFPDGGGAPETAFLGGEVPLFVANISDVSDMVENGQGRVIAIMDEERSPFLPDVPTFAEEGYDVNISSSRGYVFPECAPDAAVEKISEAMGEVMADEEFPAKMEQLGLAANYKDAAEYADYWAETVGIFEELLPVVRAEAQ